MSKLKISIESKLGKLPDTSALTDKALSYIDMNNSSDSESQSIMALAHSSANENTICESILSHLKQLFSSDFFSEPLAPSANPSEAMHSKLVTLFTEINGKLLAMRKQSASISASLNVGILSKSILYLGVSGNLNVLLYRESVLYNLHLQDDVFTPIKPNSNKNKIILMGTTIIPQIDTFKLSLKEGDILIFISSAISESMDDKEILTALEFSETREDALDRIINSALGRSTGKYAALVSLSSENQLKLPAKEDSGRIIAELPPEYPPALGDLIELKRSSEDYYNTSQLKLKQKVTPSLETTKIPDGEIERSISKNNTPSKVVMFFISLFITVALGLFWFYNSDMLSPSFNTNWEVRANIKIDSINWKNQEIPFKGNVIVFKNESDSKGKLIIEPKENKYDCELIINTSEPVEFKSMQGNDTIASNEVSLDKKGVFIFTNLTGTVDREKMNSINTDPEGKKYFVTTLRIKNLKGQLIINSKPMKILRQVEFDLLPSIER